MRKIIHLIHLSLDGFAAGPNDELGWIADDINVNPKMLGRGKPLFAVVTRPFPLTLLQAKTFQSGVVAWRYAPDRTPPAPAS